ncbi:MAG: lamin tail domain-containing protein [Jatrophihabitantaceae bacterium]
MTDTSAVQRPIIRLVAVVTLAVGAVAIVTFPGGPAGATTASTTVASAASIATVPGAPTIGAASGGPLDATVAFTAPADNGGSPITGYTVSASDTTTPGNGGQSASGTSSPITVGGLTAGDTYTFTVTATNGVGTGPASGASNPVTASATRSVIVSELRLAGPGGPTDKYVDLYNDTAGPVSLSGWSLGYGTDSGGAARVGPKLSTGCPTTESSIALSGYYLPVGGYLLIAGSGYSLNGYSTPDLAGLAASPDQGVKVVAPDGEVSDAVGMTCAPPDLHAGTPLAVPTQTAAQSAYVRVIKAGVPVDTGNNAHDFRFVATDRATSSHGVGNATQGAPGPTDHNNNFGPVNSQATAPSVLLDQAVGPQIFPNFSYSGGVLTIRRTITNNTGNDITLLRLRITGITTLGDTAANQAQLELISTGARRVDGFSTVATTLDSPPSAPAAGGLNSIVSVALPGGQLFNGASVQVAISFTVLRGGKYSFSYQPETVMYIP